MVSGGGAPRDSCGVYAALADLLGERGSGCVAPALGKVAVEDAGAGGWAGFVNEGSSFPARARAAAIRQDAAGLSAQQFAEG